MIIKTDLEKILDKATIVKPESRCASCEKKRDGMLTCKARKIQTLHKEYCNWYVKGETNG